jgi:hypothetical protein
MDQEFARIRGYLQVQASKLTVPELVEKVRADLQQVKSAIETFPPSRWNERPSESEWSANEVAAHLAESSQGVSSSIVAVIEHGARQAPIRDEMSHTDDRRSPLDWWSQVAADREALFSRLATVKGDEHLDIVWEHPMFGGLNWREWLLFTRIHDLDHARQIQSVAQSLG